MLVFSQVYSKNSPISRTVLLWFPDPPTMKFDHVDGIVPGRVTDPAQLGALASLTVTFLRGSSPLFLTLILKTAFCP